MTRFRWLIGSAAALAVGGLVVMLVGTPLLVRFPLNIDQKLQYEGTATVYVNPSTGLPLPSPAPFPLNVARQVKVVSGGLSNAVIDETIAITFAGSTRTETYQYVMNRRTMQLVDSPASFAFGNPADSMKPGASYRINLPLSTESNRTYTAWAPETASTVSLTPTGPAHKDANSGDKVVTFNSNLDHQVAPYYLSYLRTEGMPATLSPASVEADLAAHGANVTQVESAVDPYLSAGQKATLADTLAEPIPLTYSYFQQGQVSVEPTTGAIVDAGSSREGVSVTPDLAAMAPAEQILAPYASLPAVQKLAAAVSAVSAPQTVLQMTYAETAASSHSAAQTARHLQSRMSLVQWQIPAALFGLALLALLVLVAGSIRRSRPGSVHPLPTAERPSGDGRPELRKGA